jgi:hypothetical protein
VARAARSLDDLRPLWYITNVTRARFLITGLAIAYPVMFYCAMRSQMAGWAQRHDFLNLYTGATLAHMHDFGRLYDPGRQFEIEHSLVPDLPAVVPFVRPPVYAALLEPLATLPLPSAFRIWLAFQIALLMMSWGWAIWKFGPNGLIWSVMFLPTAVGVANGQDCPMILILMIVAYELAEPGWVFASGLVIGLSLFKFHLLLLFPVLMLASRRWRMLLGYCSSAAIMVITSAMLGGWKSLLDYARLLQRKDIERLSPSPERMSNIYAIATNLGVESPGVSTVLFALVIVITFFAAWRAPLWRWFAAIIAGSLLMVPHVYIYDTAALFLTTLLTIFLAKTKTARSAAVVVALPFTFWMPTLGRPWVMIPSVAILFLLIALAAEPTEEATVKGYGEANRALSCP